MRERLGTAFLTRRSGAVRIHQRAALLLLRLLRQDVHRARQSAPNRHHNEVIEAVENCPLDLSLHRAGPAADLCLPQHVSVLARGVGLLAQSHRLHAESAANPMPQPQGHQPGHAMPPHHHRFRPALPSHHHHLSLAGLDGEEAPARSRLLHRRRVLHCLGCAQRLHQPLNDRPHLSVPAPNFFFLFFFFQNLSFPIRRLPF